MQPTIDDKWFKTPEWNLLWDVAFDPRSWLPRGYCHSRGDRQLFTTKDTKENSRHKGPRRKPLLRYGPTVTVSIPVPDEVKAVMVVVPCPTICAVPFAELVNVIASLFEELQAALTL